MADARQRDRDLPRPPVQVGVSAPAPARRLPALVAPDSFKGTIAAPDVAAAIARGLRGAGREAVELPVADGGEGTMDALVRARGGELRTVVASDPLGRPVEAAFALLGDGRISVVETAQASGLGLVAAHERDAWAASTRGTGELIAAAVAAGAERVLVPVGGSATTDGGAGALAALVEAGVRPQLTVLCDVTTPFELAPAVFGPQKGTDPTLVPRLEQRLARLTDRLPRDPHGVPMTGAAAGLAGGLWAHGARLVPAPRSCSTRSASASACARRRSSSPARAGSTRRRRTASWSPRSPRAAGVPACRVMPWSAATTVGPEAAARLGLTSVTEAGTVAALEATGRALAGG